MLSGQPFYLSKEFQLSFINQIATRIQEKLRVYFNDERMSSDQVISETLANIKAMLRKNIPVTKKSCLYALSEDLRFVAEMHVRQINGKHRYDYHVIMEYLKEVNILLLAADDAWRKYKDILSPHVLMWNSHNFILIGWYLHWFYIDPIMILDL